jgi:WD40 repeat protein
MGKPVCEPLEWNIDWVRSVRLWDAATGQAISELLLGHTEYVYSVLFCRDGTRIATGSGDPTV